MLNSLFIKNIALISRLNIDFCDRINIFSGETGAGKSIIIDALNFMLGAKADKTLIRHGQDDALVEGVFDIFGREDILSLLDEYNIERDDTLLISRHMTVLGKNEIKVNGKTVTLSMLRDITHKLVDVHGQSEHFALSKVDTHLDLLDKFGKNTIQDKKESFEEHYKKYLSLNKELASFGGNDGERERLIDLYSFQIKEIEEAELVDGEEEELNARFSLLTNVEKIATNINGALECIKADEGASNALGQAKDYLGVIDKLDSRFPILKQRIQESKIEIEDIADTLEDILNSLNFDDREADKIADRLEKIKSLKRKYGSSIEEIKKYYEKTVASLDRLVNAAENIVALTEDIQKEKDILLKIGKDLTNSRKEVAAKFSKDIAEELRSLGMENATFDVQFKDGTFEELLSRNGLDSVEFMFSANLGEPLMPLVKVISGGEMSRFMLGLKSITAGFESIGTLVFDEIDTGISGKIAHVVAEKFIKLSKDCQLIIITHLPQIASTGDENLLISKGIVEDHTETSIKILNDEEKVGEIVRLSGAKDLTQAAIDNAKELIRHYENIK